MATEFTVALVVLASWLAFRVARKFTKRTTLANIRGPTRESWFFGNLAKVYDFNAYDTHRSFEENYGSVMKFYGILGEEQLYISDPQALYNIFIKEQDVYVNPEEYFIVNDIHFGNGIFSSQGDNHRRQRKLLSPAFSIAHMRTLAPIFQEITEQLVVAFRRNLSEGPREIDILNWMTRTALEFIGQAGLGYSFNTLQDGETSNAFAKAVKELFTTESKLLLARQYILPLASKIGSRKFRRFVVDSVPWKTLHEVRDILDVLHENVNQIYWEKKKAFAEGDETFFAQQPGRGKDVISTLMRANHLGDEKSRIEDSEVTGHMALYLIHSGVALVFAAMDTTSSAMAACFHMLAKNKAAQDRLRGEVVNAASGGETISYDVLSELPFLDAVCRETLRLFPPVSTVYRQTAVEARLPLSTPLVGVDGQLVHEVLIPANTAFIVSVLSSNRHPSLWGSDSYEWKPKRWLEPVPKALKEAPIPGVYSHLMTFLGGGHACLGFKFSQLEMKIVIYTLIRNFRFDLSSKEKDVFWQTTDISTPYLRTDGKTISQLPLLVTPL